MIACGCDGITKDVYDVFRNILGEELKRLITKTMHYTIHARRKTVFVEDLVHVQDLIGFRPPPRTNDEVLNTLEKVAKFGDGYFFSRAAFSRITRQRIDDDRLAYGSTMLSQSFLDEFQYHLEFTMRLAAATAARGMRVFTPIPKTGDRKTRLIHGSHLMWAWQTLTTKGLSENPTVEAQAFAKAAIKKRKKRGAAKAARAARVAKATRVAKTKARK